MEDKNRQLTSACNEFSEILRHTVAVIEDARTEILLDRLVRGADENRSIGIILCAEKDRVEVELALEDMGKPIGVADYQLIVPKEQLQKILTDEIKAFDEEKKQKSNDDKLDSL